ncbi:MAG: undecaprenyldiphospho-muramoylpentapeptide beta-N-acetylglucosaminyltransferase [Gammaproteobacteria bacterium]|jgi:UDP-N-acetylglucosamine--N-acetylmuramyl-(pentapeptide) pyrophosphoryl-undecaprenol N-acetylglucosamine transferase
MTKRVLIAAGGTGGHIFPALAIARLLQKNHIEVTWLGAKRGLETSIIPQTDIPLYTISISRLRGKKSIFHILTIPFRLLIALAQSIRIIRKTKPDVVLGMGGFVSGPGGLAAWLLRKKLIIHEQNAIPGMTNKILAHLASSAFTGFPNPKYIYAGNPVRANIAALPPPQERLTQHSGPIHLLIIGGSQGSLSFNQVVPLALAQLPAEKRPKVWHQAGKKYLAIAEQNYENAKISARIDAFITDMAKAYQWADLVISRAGASTIAELAAVGIAAILIPYPYAVDDHQTANANFLVVANAACLLPYKDFSANNLAENLAAITDRATLLNMAENGRKLRKLDAAEIVCKALDKFV